MSEQNQNQDGQKTIVAFIVGLLIGGLIVWMFSGTPAETPTDTEETDTTTEETTDENGDASEDAPEETNDTTTEETNDTPDAPVMETGDGAVEVSNQPASNRVALEAVTFPMSDGWIGVRDYSNDQLGGLLGVARFSESEGLIPEEIILQRSTEAGREYAVVFYTAGPDNNFNLATNTQIDGIFATFTAQ